MNISSKWNSSIQQFPTEVLQHHQLFQMGAPYLSSPIDGLHLLTNARFTNDFVSLLHQVGIPVRPEESAYNFGHRLGCISIQIYPKFPQTPKNKIIINPSEAGLTLRQVVEWVRFMIGDERLAIVKRIDSKVDLFGVVTEDYINRIWVDGFRSINYRYIGETLYLGSRTSKQQRVIYNKAKQKGLSTNWTRIEVRRSYEKDEQLTLNDFHQLYPTYNPFESMVLITADVNTLNNLLSRYKLQMGNEKVIDVFKKLDTYKRRFILRELKKMGFIEELNLEYQRQLRNWLSY